MSEAKNPSVFRARRFALLSVTGPSTDFGHTLLVFGLLVPPFSSSPVASAAPLAQSSNPLRGYWKLDDNLGDASPNNNNGSGFASYGDGISGHGLLRSSSDLPIKLPKFGNNGSLNLADGSITIEAWVKSSNYGGFFHHIIDNVAGYALSILDGRVAMLGPDFWWTPNDTTGLNGVSLTNPVLSLNAWHYVVGTYNGAEQALYVDGHLVAYRAISSSVPAGQGDIAIGGFGGGGPYYLFNGVIVLQRDFHYYETLRITLTGDT